MKLLISPLLAIAQLTFEFTFRKNGFPKVVHGSINLFDPEA